MLNQISRYIRLNFYTLFLKNPLHTKDSTWSPLFILSAGRSGSTLLRKILLRSGHISIPPETNSFIPTITNLYLKHNMLPWPKLIALLMEPINQALLSAHWNITLDKNDEHYIQYHLQDKSLHGLLKHIYTKYANENHIHAVIRGDKTPSLIYHTDLLNKIFPSSKYIIIIRDGRDVVSSFYTNKLYQDLDQLSKRWIYSVKIALSIFRRKGVRLAYLVKYENLVSEPSSEIEKICRFLDISYSEAYLNNTFVYMGDDHYSHHANTHKDIMLSRIGSWKKELALEDQKHIHQLMDKTLKLMGYK